MGCRTHLRLAWSMQTTCKGLGKPQSKSARLPAIGVHPPHAEKAMQSSVMFPDRLLGVCEDTVRSHVQAGDIKYIPLGKGRKRLTLRFTEDDLAEFVVSRRQRGAPCPSTGRKTRGIINS